MTRVPTVHSQSLAVKRRFAPVHIRAVVPHRPHQTRGRVRPRGRGLCLLRCGIRFRGGVLCRQRKAAGGQQAQQKWKQLRHCSTLQEFLWDLEDAKSLRGDSADPASDRFMIYGITKIALLN